jgi:hypothetical protein
VDFFDNFLWPSGGVDSFLQKCPAREFFFPFLSFVSVKGESKEGSAELCKDEEQHIMSGHLRAPLAAIAEIMLQSLSKNAPDLPTHLSLSLSLSLSTGDFCDAFSPSRYLCVFCRIL